MTTELSLERTFAASPEELWDAWTDPRLYAKWLNPAPGLDLVIHEYDVRPGGKVRFDMPQPDGSKNPQEGMFHTLEPHKRLVTGSEDRSFLLTVEFLPQGPKTRMTVRAQGVPADFHEPARKGWGAGFDKLERLLAGARQP